MTEARADDRKRAPALPLPSLSPRTSGGNSPPPSPSCNNRSLSRAFLLPLRTSVAVRPSAFACPLPAIIAGFVRPLSSQPVSRWLVGKAGAHSSLSEALNLEKTLWKYGIRALEAWIEEELRGRILLFVFRNAAVVCGASV